MGKIYRKPENSSSSKQKKYKDFESFTESYRKISPYVNIGLVMAGSVLFFVWLGVTLDNRWATHPWMTVIGAGLGIFTGFYHFFKTIQSEEKKSQRLSDDQKR